jgi:hypothetical protein
LFAFILVAAHLMALSGLASTRTVPGPVTPAPEKVSSEKIAGGQTRLPGHVLAALKGAKPMPASPGTASEPLTLTVVLKHTDQGAFDAYLQDIYDPKSPAFHRFLKQDEIAEAFGPTSEEYEQVLDYLSAKGFKLVEGSANRLTLTVRGSRAQAESAFALHIGDYRLGDRKFYANDKDPAMPTRIASSIQAIAGLSDLARPRANKDEIHNLWVAIRKEFWKVFQVKTADIPPFFQCGTFPEFYSFTPLCNLTGGSAGGFPGDGRESSAQDGPDGCKRTGNIFLYCRECRHRYGFGIGDGQHCRSSF